MENPKREGVFLNHLDGRLVHEYAFLGDNQEGIAVDEEGFLYIAQDTGGILKVKDLR